MQKHASKVEEGRDSGGHGTFNESFFPSFSFFEDRTALSMNRTEAKLPKISDRSQSKTADP